MWAHYLQQSTEYCTCPGYTRTRVTVTRDNVRRGESILYSDKLHLGFRFVICNELNIGCFKTKQNGKLFRLSDSDCVNWEY